ncbi:hypothetical protein BH10ACT3_BH10ACT3_04310 [soil metagenome]
MGIRDGDRSPRASLREVTDQSVSSASLNIAAPADRLYDDEVAKGMLVTLHRLKAVAEA